jgi:hypothetical protein
MDEIRMRSEQPVKKIVSLLIEVVRLMFWLIARVSQQIFVLAAWFKFRLDFRPRMDDIFIVSYPRSGTTWMQMILYQLATDGSMGIGHISEVVPYFERMFIAGRDPESLTAPRLFKSHLPLRGGVARGALLGIPKNRHARYIYIVRNPLDVAVSYYHFHRSHLGYVHGFDKFLADFLDGKVLIGSWFRHVAAWKQHPPQLNVLFMRYEDLADNLEGSIRRIASFCNIEIPAERMPVILERCSFNFMKERESQFDHLTETLSERGQRLHAFLREGQVGAGRDNISADQLALFKQRARQWLLSDYVG